MQPSGCIVADLKNLLPSAAEWTLAEDNKLCSTLAALSKDIEEKGNNLEKTLNNLLIRTGKLDAAVQYLNVDLSVLKNSKFIEVVIDEDDVSYRRAPSVVPQKSMAEKRDEVIGTVKSCVCESLKYSSSCFLQQRLDEDLPPLIGSTEFMELQSKQPSLAMSLNKDTAAVVVSIPERDQSVPDIHSWASKSTLDEEQSISSVSPVEAAGEKEVNRPTVQHVVPVVPPPPPPPPPVTGRLFSDDSSDSEESKREDTKENNIKKPAVLPSAHAEPLPTTKPVIRPPTAAQLANAVTNLRSTKAGPKVDDVNGKTTTRIEVNKPKDQDVKASPISGVQPKPEDIETTNPAKLEEPSTNSVPVKIATSKIEPAKKPPTKGDFDESKTETTKKPPAKSLFDESDSDEDLFKPVIKKSIAKESPQPEMKAPKVEEKAMASSSARGNVLSSRTDKYKKLFDSDTDDDDLFKSIKKSTSIGAPVDSTLADQKSSSDSSATDMPIQPRKIPGRLATGNLASILNAQLANGPPAQRSTPRTNASETSAVDSTARNGTDKTSARVDVQSSTTANGNDCPVSILPSLTKSRPKLPPNRRRPTRNAGGSSGAVAKDAHNSEEKASTLGTTSNADSSSDSGNKSVNISKSAEGKADVRKGLFDSDSDDGMFGRVNQKSSPAEKTLPPKKAISKGKAAGSLFDDDDDDLSLFRKK